MPFYSVISLLETYLVESLVPKYADTHYLVVYHREKKS
jgi:hypothetical protein